MVPGMSSKRIHEPVAIFKTNLAFTKFSVNRTEHHGRRFFPLSATDLFPRFRHPGGGRFCRRGLRRPITPTEKAIALYYAVRDRIKYDPYDLRYSRSAMQASTILAKQCGYCVAKAVLLTAVGRHQGIPMPPRFRRCHQPPVNRQAAGNDGHRSLCLSRLQRDVSWTANG